MNKINDVKKSNERYLEMFISDIKPFESDLFSSYLRQKDLQLIDKLIKYESEVKKCQL